MTTRDSTDQTDKPKTEPERGDGSDWAAPAPQGPASPIAGPSGQNESGREDWMATEGDSTPPESKSSRIPDVDQIVEYFNVRGYERSFAAAAKALGAEPSSLYKLYESREALGEIWLCGVVPQSAKQPSVREMFSGCVFPVLIRLQDRRDFSRAWLAALRVNGPLHLRQLHELHETLRQYFIGWLGANQGLISLPRRMTVDDVVSELADALCAVTIFMVTAWEADRSKQYQDTCMLVESTACVLDALLTSRRDLGDAGLLTHLTRIVGVPHGQFVEPLLDSLLKPERVQRLAIVQLIEGLRALRFPTGSAP